MIYIFTFAFICMDFATGLIKAFKEKNYCSTIMRQGLYHKAGSILCVILGVLVDHAQEFLDLGVSLPVTEGFCGYIVLMEVGSIIENVCKINPEILPDKMKQYFNKLKK